MITDPVWSLGFTYKVVDTNSASAEKQKPVSIPYWASVERDWATVPVKPGLISRLCLLQVVSVSQGLHLPEP